MSALALIGLSLLAALFALGGLVKSARSASHQHTARALYQQRLEELDSEVADPEARQAVELEASRALLEDAIEDAVEGESVISAEAKRDWRSEQIKILLVAAAIPLFGWLWFLSISDLGLSEIKGAEVVLQLNAEDAAQKTELEGWLEKLNVRIVAEPEDAKSLYLLAHTHLKLGDFRQAATTFARTSQINPDDMTVKVYWLQSRFLSAGGSLDQVSLSLAEELLAKSPNLSVALEILAMDAVRKGDAQSAVQYLNRALSGVRDAQMQANFVIAINELRKQIELPGVSVTVSAKAPVPQQSTLFVIARPVGGGMPLAVVKMPALLLPQTVRLDDLVTMSGTTKLTDTDAFQVVVRVSRSGSPMRQADDWHWESAALNLKDENELSVILEPPG